MVAYKTAEIHLIQITNMDQGTTVPGYPKEMFIEAVDH